MSASSLGYTPGTGAQVATDLAPDGHHQKAVNEYLDAEGVPVPVSASFPFPVGAHGELIEAIESMRFAINSLTKTIGFGLPNALGQQIVEVRQPSGANLNVTASGTMTANIGTGTLAACTTLTNQAQIGGFVANDKIPALMHLQADNLRRNIVVT